MEGEEIFGSCKRKANLAPRSEGDSHRHDCANLFHHRVSHIIANSSVNIEKPIANQIEEDVEVLEAPCRDGVWHIEKCPPTSHVQCFDLQKSTKHSYAIGIITKPTFIGVPASTYSRLWFQFLGAPLKLHKFWFYAYDMNYCVGNTKHKYALDRSTAPKIWPIKVQTNFT
jgi:hypothetical protein